MDTKEAAIRLWAHECQRVFSDRFVQDAADDQGRFREVKGVLHAPACGESVKQSLNLDKAGDLSERKACREHPPWSFSRKQKRLV